MATSTTPLNLGSSQPTTFVPSGSTRAFLVLTATALLLGGAMIIANDVVHLGYMTIPQDATLEDVASSPVHLTHGATHVIYGLLIMLGLMGLAVHHGAALGRLGLGALVVGFVGAGLMAMMYFAFTVGSTAAPEAFLGDAGPSGLLATLAPVLLWAGMGSLALVGAALAWRVPVYRWAGLLVAVFSIVFVVVPLPAGPEAIVGGSVAWIGLRLLGQVRASSPPVDAPTPTLASS